MASPSNSDTNSMTQNTETAKIDSFTRAKLSAVSKFETLKQAFSSKREPTVIFPPPSWSITDDVHPPEETDSKQEYATTETQDEAPNFEAPEPKTFAMKIRHLIDELPLPAGLAGALGLGSSRDGAITPVEGAKGDPTTVAVNSEGPPIPDVVDDKTMKYLSSEDVMNGYAADASGSRQSVWQELERMKHDGNIERTDPTTEAKHDEGVMMYAPLEPKVDSEVELAESELEYVDEKPVAGKEGAKNEGKGKAKAEDTSSPPELSQPATLEKHWVPSTTKISVFTAWWGYRLYLPPPVMARLGSNQIKATQRAAMVTTALQWFLKKVPTTFIPPQLRPAVKVLQRLSPLLGYIGVFVAWSWTRITKYDKGNGVVLSATWLLPVALIPMSWDAGDIQGPKNRPPAVKDEEAQNKEDGDQYSKKDKVKK